VHIWKQLYNMLHIRKKRQYIALVKYARTM
jgi:hypothetical protein